LFGYTVALEPNKAVFYMICGLIEKKCANLQKEQMLEDVDGSLIQVFNSDGYMIRVDNDHEVGCVSVESEIPLDIPHIHEYNAGNLK
jgi:hypothetical protein